MPGTAGVHQYDPFLGGAGFLVGFLVSHGDACELQSCKFRRTGARGMLDEKGAASLVE